MLMMAMMIEVIIILLMLSLLVTQWDEVEERKDLSSLPYPVKIQIAVEREE